MQASGRIPMETPSYKRQVAKFSERSVGSKVFRAYLSWNNLYIRFVKLVEDPWITTRESFSRGARWRHSSKGELWLRPLPLTNTGIPTSSYSSPSRRSEIKSSRMTALIPCLLKQSNLFPFSSSSTFSSKSSGKKVAATHFEMFLWRMSSVRGSPQEGHCSELLLLNLSPGT